MVLTITIVLMMKMTFVLFCAIQIVQLCLEYICYDPNYNYGTDDEDESMETDQEDEQEEE